VLLAGALLVAPGFVSDVLALLLLVPPVRALARRLLAGWVARRVLTRRPPATGRYVDGSVVDGSVIDGSVVERPAQPPQQRRELDQG
jgi:UPF0716 protein FxsA